LAVIEQEFETLGGVDAEMMRALRADVEVGGEILVVDGLCAPRAFHPEPFRDATRFFGACFPRLARLFEPRHVGSSLPLDVGSDPRPISRAARNTWFRR